MVHSCLTILKYIGMKNNLYSVFSGFPNLVRSETKLFGTIYNEITKVPLVGITLVDSNANIV